MCFCECDIRPCVQVSEMGVRVRDTDLLYACVLCMLCLCIYVSAIHASVLVCCVSTCLCERNACVCVMYLCISVCVMLCLWLFFVAHLSVDCLFVTVCSSMSPWCLRGSLSVAYVSVYSVACVGLCDALLLRGRGICVGGWPACAFPVQPVVPASLCVTCTCPRLPMAVHLCM